MNRAATILASVGGLAAGSLGALWLRDAIRFGGDAALARGLGIDPAALWGAGLALLVAMFGGLAGAVLAHRGHRGAAALLLVVGIAPGLVDPRAFVATNVLCLAGLLARDQRRGAASRALATLSPRREEPSMG